MTDEQARYVYNVLKEHLDSFYLVGYDSNGERIALSDYPNKISEDAIVQRLRTVLRDWDEMDEFDFSFVDMDDDDDEGDEWKDEV